MQRDEDCPGRRRFAIGAISNDLYGTYGNRAEEWATITTEQNEKARITNPRQLA